MTASESFLLVPLLAFLVGLVLGSFLSFLPVSIVSLLFVLAVCVAWCERRGYVTMPRGFLIYACVLAGVVYWVACDETLARSSILEAAGNQPVLLQGRIVQPVRHIPGGVIMICAVETIEREGHSQSVEGLVRVMWRDPDLTVFQGDAVNMLTRVRPPWGTKNPGGFDYERYLKRKGIQAVASLSGPQQVVVDRSQSPRLSHVLTQVVGQWRHQVRQAALNSLENPALGLYVGMIIGEQSFIPLPIRDAFMATGTVHIISISGSHLGLVAFLSFFLVKTVFRAIPGRWIEQSSRFMTPTQVAVAATLPLVVFYTLLAGSEVATVRSLLMILLFFGGIWLGRERHMLLALGIAALAVTVHDPQALFDVSFQLSYGAVLAMALFLRGNSFPESGEEPLSPKRRVARWLQSYAGITISVTIVTLPIVAYAFHQIAWLGLVANSVVVPIVGLLAVPVGLFSAVGVLVLGTESLPFAGLNQWIFDGVADLVVGVSRVPKAAWHVASPSPFSMMVFYLVLLLMVWRWHSRSVQWGGAALLCCILAWWIWSPRVLDGKDSFRVTYLDVGQGDATVLELPEGLTVLIDGGVAFQRWDAGRNIVGPYLWDRGIRRLDHVIATHPQLDHVGGLAWVLENFDVGDYWTNGLIRDKPFFRALQHVVDRVGVHETVALENQPILESPFCQLRTLNSGKRGNGRSLNRQEALSGTILNNHSIVVRLDCGPHSFLFPADVEQEGLKRLSRNPASQSVQVVKIPHHGAKSSFDRSWIEGLQGRVAVVSAGQGNRYGHPAPEVVAAYQRQGMTVYRTDQDGAVWIEAEVSSLDLHIETARAQMLSPIFMRGASLERIMAEERVNWQRLFRQFQGVM